MGKPSMFSRDYNKIMERRKKIRRTISIIVIIIISGIGLILASDIGDGILLSDSDINTEDINNQEETNSTTDEEIKKVEEDLNVIEDIEVKFNILDKEIIFICTNENGAITFKEIKDNVDNIYYSLNSTKNMATIIDSNQNMYIAKVNGEITDITLKEYVSTSGQKFEKNMILEMYENYKWNANAVFLDDERVAYVSNIPYFGDGVSDYVAVINITTNERTTLWEFKADEIIFGSFNENGLEVNLDGNIKYIK